MSTSDNSKAVGTRKPKKNFRVQIKTLPRSLESPTLREEIDNLNDQFYDAGARVIRYSGCEWNGWLTFLFNREHRDVVRKILIQCLLNNEIEECYTGSQHLAWDFDGRPFIESTSTSHVCRRYLDLKQDAPQPVAEVSTPMPMPQVACVTEVLQ